MNNMISIIIRTKNEERWITQCLQGVFSQVYKNFEVIIVDNESSDRIIEKARQFKIAKVITCKAYLPGKALNMGIEESKGDYVVCLSGHCIPVNDQWLSNLIRNFDDSRVAGVYGRQEPMSFTTDADKRDLNLVFGLDRKVQNKDSFFHNANSMIRRSVWNEVPFDEKATNIEDRLWAKEILQNGYKIIYEPEASVYHYHGIHQNGDPERCTNVVKILDTIHGDHSYKSIEIDKMNIVVFIPMRGKVTHLNNKPLLAYTIEHARESKYVKRIIVATDNEEMARIAEKLGAEIPFMRDPLLSGPSIDLDKVLSYSLHKLEELRIFPDLIVSLEATFPFRPKSLIDDMIVNLAQNGLDSIVAAKAENKAIWKEKDGEILQIDEGLTPRQFKDPTFIELRGVGCVTHPEFLRQGRLMGDKIGIYEVNDPYSSIEVRNGDDFKLASLVIKDWSV